GAGGSNAHLIVEEYVAPAREATAIRGPVAMVLSARTQERLQVQVQQIIAYLDQQEINLAELAYTLQVGREAFGVRLALVVSSVEELKRKLAQVSQNKPSLEDVYRGEVKGTQETLAVFRADEDLQRAIEAWMAKGKIGKLAELWVQGLVVDWAALYGEPKPQRVSLPTYPFAPERYWVPEAGSKRDNYTLSISSQRLHPLVHRNSSDLSEQRYSTTLSGEENFLRDHVVAGKPIVPGVVQLEWARAAVCLALGGESRISLEQVSWLRPLVVESALEVHIGLREEPEGGIGYEIYSGQDEEAVVYSQGYAVVVEAGKQAPQIDLSALVKQCQQTLTEAASYEQFTSLGIEYGSSFQVLKEVRYGAGVAVGALELSSESNQEGYSWSPSLLDGALQTSIGLLMGEPQQERGLVLPFAVQRVEQWAGVPSVAWAIVRPAKGDSAAVRKLDIAIVDKEGQVALQMSGFSTRAVQDSEPVGASQTVLAVPEWKVQAVTECSPKEGLYSAHWVILCEVEAEFGFETDIAPARCIRLKADEGSLEARYSSYAAQLLKQLQVMVSNGLKSAVLVQLVVPLSEVVLQGLSGLLRSAQREYPLLVGQVVGVESKTELARRLGAEASAGVAVVRYGSAGREVLSYREWESSSAGEVVLPWRAGGVYWITGGLGGLGRVFAQAIAQQAKAAVVVLSGRRRELTPKEEAFIEGLKEQGLRVEYRAVEVSEAGAMRELAQGIVAQYGRLNGVVHSAGVLNDGLLVNKSPEQLAQVLRPKVRGLVALDEATQDMGLEWLLLCSSMTSVVGNVGQSDYGAANGFMDSYAQYRQGLVEVGQRQGRTVS
ncbi:MAG TPA: SDR family NAD(P)-dependent oxidoreductase, partial [Ktedonobacteraceae bacterium]|nr:SDR family NAD(P)-dependent oxidoreductase [Ktedonobacteraceae bacterium]